MSAYVMVSAPLLMMTEGPAMTIDAPWPFMIVISGGADGDRRARRRLDEHLLRGVVRQRQALVPVVVCIVDVGRQRRQSHCQRRKPSGSGQKAPDQIG